MLWSLLKIVLFLAVVAGLTLGASTLMDTSGGVILAFGGQEFSLSPLKTLIAAAILLVLLWIVFKLVGLTVAFFRFLSGDETAITRYFSRNRERKGYTALSEGMMALASGDGRTAIAKATRAEKFLNKPELTDVLTAQAAEMSGDRKTAEEVYKRLVTRDDTRFVGVRGLMMQQLADGQTEKAMKLAEKAFALKPRHEETQDTLLKLQAAADDWKGARQTLNAKLKYGSLPRDVHKRRDAVLALSEAKDILAAENGINVQEAAIEANRLSPDLIPAAVMAAQAYIDQSKPRYATRVVQKAWDAQPHPDLAAAFADIAADETAQDRIKRFATLTKATADHPESRHVMAELHLAAEDFPAAKTALGDLIDTGATARTYAIMAAIERGMGAEEPVVRGWLAKAVNAARGPQWVCEQCNHVHPGWVAVCEGCQSFDTLSWKEVPQTDLSLPASQQMLPLIVGAIAQEAESVEDAEEVTPGPPIFPIDAEVLPPDPAVEPTPEATQK